MSFARPSPSVFLAALKRHGLFIILAVVLIKQLVAVAVVPPWLVPDEAAHLQYIRTLILERRIPELRGRLIVYDPAMSDFFQRGDLRQIGYEERKKYEIESYWHKHPSERSATARYNPAGAYSPLYYLAVGWPLLFVGDASIQTQLLVVRGLSALLLLAAVWMAWRIVANLGGSSGFAATVALVTGFHPGMSLNFAGVNNDALLITGGLVLIEQLTRWFSHRPAWTTLLWVALGSGLLTLVKPVGASVTMLTAIMVLTVFGRKSRTGWLRAGSVVVIGGVVGGLWMIREALLGQNTFLLDPELWKIQSRLLPDVTWPTIIRGDLTYWWPASFFTYWGEYFAKEKIPTVLPLGYFATILGFGLAAVVGWVYAWRKRALDASMRRWLRFGLLAVVVHEVWLWLIHLQTVFRYRDYQFLYHGRYRLIVAPLVLLLIIGGLEKLWPPNARPFVRGGLVLFFIFASSYALWIAAHV